MMMECSDLSADKKGRGFVKKTAVNQVPVSRPHSTAVTYSESKAACHWTGDTGTLSELFTLPGRYISLSHPPYVLPHMLKSRGLVTRHLQTKRNVVGSKCREPPDFTFEQRCLVSLRRTALRRLTEDERLVNS